MENWLCSKQSSEARPPESASSCALCRQLLLSWKQCWYMPSPPPSWSWAILARKVHPALKTSKDFLLVMQLDYFNCPLSSPPFPPHGLVPSFASCFLPGSLSTATSCLENPCMTPKIFTGAGLTCSLETFSVRNCPQDDKELWAILCYRFMEIK